MARPHPPRAGELRAAANPAQAAGDARLVFIGRIRTPWQDRDDCPKNLREARARLPGEGGAGARVEVDPEWRPALLGLEAGMPVLLLYWMHAADRDLLVQWPRHREAPVGTFALRSPARPNPIALAAVRLLSVDRAAGRLEIDAIDCLDGTPLLDIKPWLAGVDVPPGTQSPA